MLAGAGGIDVVLLVVAADESIKPQTREHFDICQLLGILAGVVAMTKADLVDADMLGLVRLEIEEFVRGTFLDGAPIVPVSATDGRRARGAETGAAARGARGSCERCVAVFAARSTARLRRKDSGRWSPEAISGRVKINDEMEMYPGGGAWRARAAFRREPGRAGCGGPTHCGEFCWASTTEIERGMGLAPRVFSRPAEQVKMQITVLQSARP